MPLLQIIHQNPKQKLVNFKRERYSNILIKVCVNTKILKKKEKNQAPQSSKLWSPVSLPPLYKQDIIHQTSECTKYSYVEYYVLFQKIFQCREYLPM